MNNHNICFHGVKREIFASLFESSRVLYFLNNFIKNKPRKKKTKKKTLYVTRIISILIQSS